MHLARRHRLTCRLPPRHPRALHLHLHRRALLTATHCHRPNWRADTHLVVPHAAASHPPRVRAACGDEGACARGDEDDYEPGGTSEGPKGPPCHWRDAEGGVHAAGPVKSSQLDGEGRCPGAFRREPDHRDPGTFLLTLLFSSRRLLNCVLQLESRGVCIAEGDTLVLSIRKS